MLEVKNLCKTYRSKDGVSVEAAKNISLRFPEKGMVFILGRSGSGKSTLLHLLGGLDRYDSGEILIHGTSTKDFSNAMMDSYRNTYVGFIFQDYNVLPEFTVGANVALAMELQGVKASNERINEILAEVDLSDYAKRKPNELSGGQLQRVAIARALIKDPDIILADEPTGALDSATGRVVFDTLKRLSKRKLVIIVSHDRDYSEQYADRIVELADGVVVSDVECKPLSELPDIEETVFLPEDGIIVERDGLVLDAGYTLTEEDREKINRYLMLQKDGNVLLTEGTRVTPKKERFFPTDEKAIVPEKTVFQLIKSKLPWKRSFGIGVNSMRYKKGTLILTILLSLVAFAMFGVADTLAAFKRETCTFDSIRLAKRAFLTIDRAYSETTDYNTFTSEFTTEEIEQIKKDTGVAAIPMSAGMYVSFVDMQSAKRSEGLGTLFPAFSYSIVEIDEEVMKILGAKLVCGRLPAPGSNEVCISSLAAEGILLFDENYRGKTMEDILGDGALKGRNNGDISLPVVGIIELPIDTSAYREMVAQDVSMLSDSERVLHEILYSLCSEECAYGVPSALFCGVGSSRNVAAGGSGVVYADYDQYIFCGPEGEDYTTEIKSFAPFSAFSPEDIRYLGGFTGISNPETDLIVSELLMQELFYPEIRDAVGIEVYDWINETVPAERRNLYCALLTELSNTLTISDTKGRTYRIIGICLPENSDEKDWTTSSVYAVVSDERIRAIVETNTSNISTVIIPTPQDDATLRKLIKYCFEDRGGFTYAFGGQEQFTIDTMNRVATVVSPVLKWFGGIMAAFSAILFGVFIANSILHKRQEIGVLRALGARSLDVYRIFLCETAVIAFINGLLAVLVARGIVGFINSNVSDAGSVLKNIQLLHFGARQVGITFGIAALVAIVATFIPVWGIARKKPIDVIRGR